MLLPGRNKVEGRFHCGPCVCRLWSSSVSTVCPPHTSLQVVIQTRLSRQTEGGGERRKKFPTVHTPLDNSGLEQGLPQRKV